MAYALLTTSGVHDAAVQVHAWLSSSAPGGANLPVYDDLGATDKVYVLSGETGAGRMPMFLRVSEGRHEKAPGASGPQHHAEGIVSELSPGWDLSTHKAKCPVGRMGRRAMLQTHNGDRTGFYNLAGRKPGLTPEIVPSGFRAAQGFQWEFDGRNIISWTNVNPTQTEYANPDYINYQPTRPDNRAGQQAQCTIINPVTGKQEMFYFVRQDQQAVAISFAKFDWGNKTHYPLADAPWSLGGTSYYINGWDGDDKIYFAKMYQVGSNDFAYYSISTNTWTSLPALTITAGNFDYDYTKGGQYLRYVPASMSGFSEDCIYYLCPTWAGDVTWFRYKVTTGAWETSGGAGFPNLPWPKYQYGHQALWVDSEAGTAGSLYYAAHDNFTMNQRLWRFDFAATAWQAEDTNFNVINNGTPWSSDNSGNVFLPMHQHCGKLYLPSANANLVIQCTGNKDYIALMATWVAPATSPGPSYQIQRYSYAGYVNSVKRTDFFAVASNITPGVNKTIALTTSIANKLAVGDTFRIYNHTFNGQPDYHGGTLTPGGGELVQIMSITDATHIVVDRVTGTYNVGTDSIYVTQDGMNCVVGNDSGWFVRARGGTGGYQSDSEADVLFLAPTIQATLTGVGFDNISQISGYSLYQKYAGLNYGGGQGELYGIFVAHPNANVNDTFIVDGHPYTVFKSFLSELSKDTRLSMIGPTDA